MSRPNDNLAPLVFLLVLTSAFPPKFAVLGSPAQERIYKRPDPLRGLKNYKGGYNVTDKHYLASVAFTGVHGYVIAGVWLLCGLALGIFVVCRHMIGRESSSVKEHLSSYSLIVLFTLLAIVATGFVLGANETSSHRTKRFKGSIVKAGDNMHRTIYRVVKAMTEIQVLLRPYDPGTAMTLYTFTHILANDSQKVQNFVQKSGRKIDLAIQTSRVFHLVVVTVNLLLLVASLVLLFLHWHPGILIVIFFFWILTTICWTLTGFDFFLHTFVHDTCAAFFDYQQDPQNSSLSSIIPCMDPSFSDGLLAQIGSTIHNFMSELHSRIKELYILLGLHVDLGLGNICDPFSGPPNYNYTPEICPKDAIAVGQIPNILSNLTCFRDNSSATCTKTGRIIPQTFYDMASAYSRSIQHMIDIFPDVQSMTKCKIVKATFSDVVNHQCKPFKFSIKLLWSSMLSLSIFMVVLVSIWVLNIYPKIKR